MTKYVKIIYENWVMERDGYKPAVTDALVPFCDKNTAWTDGLTYAENFDILVQDVFDCGFIYINDTKAVTVLQIKSFEHHDPQHKQNKPTRKRTTRRKPSNRTQKKEIQEGSTKNGGTNSAPKTERPEPPKVQDSKNDTHLTADKVLKS
jgi:hypothetical protein